MAVGAVPFVVYRISAPAIDVESVTDSVPLNVPLGADIVTSPLVTFEQPTAVLATPPVGAVEVPVAPPDERAPPVEDELCGVPPLAVAVEPPLGAAPPLGVEPPFGVEPPAFEFCAAPPVVLGWVDVAPPMVMALPPPEPDGTQAGSSAFDEQPELSTSARDPKRVNRRIACILA